MTQDVAFQSPVPVPSPPPRKQPRGTPDSDRFFRTAKQLVVDNFNSHRDETRSSALQMNDVYIVWFTKGLGNWKAIVTSPVARGLLWEISCNEYKQEAYITIYKKNNYVKISLGESE